MPGSVIAGLLTFAKKINNYALDATGGGLWATTQSYKVVCPASKRRFLLGGHCKRAVSSTVTVYIKDAADAIIHVLANAAAGTTIVSFPTAAVAADVQQAPAQSLVMDAGEYVEAVFGTAQNASSAASCAVLEVDV